MNPVERYARDVADRRLPAGKYHRLACGRHLTDLARQGTPAFPYVFAWAKADEFLRFARLMKHYKGRQFAGKGFEPTPFQVFRLGSLFGWRQQTTGYRRFTTAYNEVPRKQGKSFEAAILAVYCTFFEGEPGAEGYCIATKEKQARIVFDAAKKLVKASGLSSRIKVNASNLHREATESKLEPLGSDSDTTDGLSPHFIGTDELHAFKTRGLLDVVESATGARVNPMHYQITTAGDDPVSPCGDQHDYACRILDGVLEDDASTLSFFACIAHADTAYQTSYGSSLATQEMVRLCSCKHQESEDHRAARLRAILIGGTTPAACATPVTGSGLSSRTPSITHGVNRKAVNGRLKTRIEISRTNGDGTRLIQSEGLAPEDGRTSSLSLQSRSMNTADCSHSNGIAVESVESSASGSPLTTATARVESGDFCVSSATQDSDTLETMRLEYERHSPTCAVRTIGRIESGRFVVSYPEDDPWAEATWIKANPHWGVSVEPEDMRKLAAKAQKMPSAAAEFKQKRLNLWVNATAPCLSVEGWRTGQSRDVALAAWLAELEHEPCYVGIDLASKIDLCALAFVFPPTTGRPRWRWFLQCWTPADTLPSRAHRDRAPYDVWREQGWLTTTPGTRVDHQVIRATLAAYRQRFDIEQIGFDPWHADTLIDQLVHEDGFTAEQVIAVPQTYAGMSSACLRVQADILAGEVDARGCPVTGWAVSNTVGQMDGKDNLLFVKGKSRGRIDPVIAATIGTALKLRQPSEQESVYATRGLTAI